jgi:uridine kinase
MINARKDVKLVLIAGPSSSGKTTFSKRLGVQLRVNGLIPVPISLDNYFMDRKHTPKDENGDYDFESLYALDIELFNKNLESLLRGDETRLPDYNFLTGEHVWNEHKLKLPSNGVVVVEGIHGLNDTLTQSILSNNKFKIYISALTQLNIDYHNRIATTDVRIIRRIVRDHLFRGYGGEDTLRLWPSIRRGGRKKHICISGKC